MVWVLEKKVASTSVVWPLFILTIHFLGKHQMFFQGFLWAGDSSNSGVLGQRAHELGRPAHLFPGHWYRDSTR